MHAAHEVPTWVKWTPFTAMAIGLFLAWNSYIRNTSLPARFVAQFKLLHQFLFNKWRSEEHTSELQSLMSISYPVFCLNNTMLTEEKNKHNSSDIPMTTLTPGI